MVQKRKGPPFSGAPVANTVDVAGTAAGPGVETTAGQPAAPVRKRGRPRAFTPEVALSRALDRFRDGGYAATSLDDLSAAMGINRPSLYGAFGDKRELFLKAYERYREEVGGQFATAFDPALTLRQSMERIFATALDVYLAGENGPRGCFTVMTAGSEAMADPEIRGTVLRALASTDKALRKLLELAIVRGELPAGTDVELLVQVAGSAIHTIAIRARAWTPRADLEVIARRAIDFVCAGGAAPVERRR
ncbi:TetR/AcrR family transcriptional regulator [Bradyrhizobium sp. U87765 SZCCT0131]|uniref:TetR/AcrR family transcriptional regulator n=1 Tax=unclassified Bradyrhizobium TaxID=2631580 RepID=UPI001BA9B821|nr:MULTISPECIES: TetR/AcrR family transcriptional regulator [unclassified Bradyrhizobium]MBR1220822.1 TetR/AcrR family transcriptional regulator [Bradyrhizobium sp. U87765 SZCCT0131]MBR1260358.1 TetR/AcrR family transcriptional regulator [Bradyrhizobium sp. U87765 SZCCT0134]MBR1307393.1 TetR/AcrR family transcriptional regulator [Bradyrhizobium sp. U87765 SZCCT0110]MBR1321347.1 TetR/AcrR family transcriptional regulator [Bradyrhizobium sp. U87765 SZCCT0109]MBR1349660.1 TetR/AcrR family transcr